MALSGVSFN